MVGFAVAGWAVAAGCSAVAVSCDERVPELGWDGAGGAADVDDLAGPVGDDPADVAVAGDPFERGARQPPDVRGFGADVGDQLAVVWFEGLEIDHDAHLRPAVAAGAGLVVVVFEGAAADLDERVGVSDRAVTGVAGPGEGGVHGVERGHDDLARLGVERAVGDDPVAEG